MVRRYAVMVDLQGRPCLVVGGGTVATRKVRGLLDVGAEVTVTAPVLSPSLAELATTGAITWIEAPYTLLGRSPDERRWVLVVAATDAPDVNDRVAADAERAGVWANHAGAPDGGPVSVPSVAADGPLTVAVSTDGIHPGAARWLADQALASLGPEPAVALRLIHELRLEDRQAGGPGRRPDWRRAVDSGTLDLIRAGLTAEAKERLQACLSSSLD